MNLNAAAFRFVVCSCAQFPSKVSVMLRFPAEVLRLLIWDNVGLSSVQLGINFANDLSLPLVPVIHNYCIVMSSFIIYTYTLCHSLLG
jgi:hypothetical protein